MWGIIHKVILFSCYNEHKMCNSATKKVFLIATSFHLSWYALGSLNFSETWLWPWIVWIILLCLLLLLLLVPIRLIPVPSKLDVFSQFLNSFPSQLNVFPSNRSKQESFQPLTQNMKALIYILLIDLDNFQSFHMTGWFHSLSTKLWWAKYFPFVRPKIINLITR